MDPRSQCIVMIRKSRQRLKQNYKHGTKKLKVHTYADIKNKFTRGNKIRKMQNQKPNTI